ncbi:MAG TPA: hypothetical protein ENL03_01975, partial [Phycisphaerae bacterium]|nr:hypothetical protein [Phycisphaerae bacterium]
MGYRSYSPSAEAPECIIHHVIANVLAATPVKNRPQALEMMIKPISRTRGNVLLRLGMILPGSEDEALASKYADLLTASFKSTDTIDPNILLDGLITLAALRPGLAAAVCRNPKGLDPAAIAMIAPDTQTRAKALDSLLAQTLQGVSSAKSYERFNPDEWRMRGRLLTSDQLTKVLAALDKKPANEDSPALYTTIEALLLSGAEQETLAADALVKALANAASTSTQPRAEFFRQLQGTCRDRLLAETFKANVDGKEGLDYYGWSDQAWSYLNLYRPADGLMAAGLYSDQASHYGRLDIARASMAMGSKTDALAALRRCLIPQKMDYSTWFRVSSGYRRFIWPNPPSDDLLGDYPPKDGLQMVQGAFALIDKVTAVNDLNAFLGALPIQSTSISSSRRARGSGATQDRVILPYGADSYARAIAKCSHDKQAGEVIASQLMNAIQRNAMTRADWLLVTALSWENPSAVPKEFLPAIEKALALGYNEITPVAAASIFHAHGKDDLARNLLKWIVAQDAVYSRGLTMLDDYLALCPESQRKSEAMKHLQAAEPTPVETFSPGDRTRLALLGKYATDDEVKKQADILRLCTLADSYLARERCTGISWLGGSDGILGITHNTSLRLLRGDVARLDFQAGRMESYNRMLGTVLGGTDGLGLRYDPYKPSFASKASSSMLGRLSSARSSLGKRVTQAATPLNFRELLGDPANGE